MVRDVTDRWNARRLLALVSEAGASIGSTLDVQRTARELADFAVPRFADFVFVDLLETPFGGDRPGSATPAEGERPAMRRAGMSSVRDGCPRPSYGSARPWTSCHLRTTRTSCWGRPVLLPVLDPDSHGWTVEHPARAARIREFVGCTR